MHDRRQYLLDVVRSKDGKRTESGVRFAQLELSFLKAMEISAAAEMKLHTKGMSRVVARSPDSVLTESEVIWLDESLKPMKPRFQFCEQVRAGYPPSFIVKSLVQIDRSGCFYFWNLFGTHERVRTHHIAASALVADFRTPAYAHVCVAPGIRRLMEQQALLSTV